MTNKPSSDDRNTVSLTLIDNDTKSS